MSYSYYYFLCSELAYAFFVVMESAEYSKDVEQKYKFTLMHLIFNTHKGVIVINQNIRQFEEVYLPF